MTTPKNADSKRETSALSNSSFKVDLLWHASPSRAPIVKMVRLGEACHSAVTLFFLLNKQTTGYRPLAATGRLKAGTTSLLRNRRKSKDFASSVRRIAKSKNQTTKDETQRTQRTQSAKKRGSLCSSVSSVVNFSFFPTLQIEVLLPRRLRLSNPLQLSGYPLESL